MKLIFFLLGSLFLSAQVAVDSAYSVTYLHSFRFNETDEVLRQEYVRLMVKGDESLFQSYNAMMMDSLNARGTATPTERNTYYAYHKFAIEIDGNDLTFYDDIGNDGYRYKESLEHQWQLIDESMEINGYDCKKAVTHYAGRLWTAWYATELPINAGPYKFKGLPGLILKISDDTASYDYSIYAIVKKPSGPLKRYYHRVPLEQKVDITRLEFNKMRVEWSKLSLNEALNVMNKDSPTTLSYQVTSLSGEKMDVGQNRRPEKERMFMEIE